MVPSCRHLGVAGVGRMAGGALLLALAVGPAACGSTQPAARPAVTVRAAPAGDRGQEGLASWYSPALAGRRTANGERYDPGAMTAAHLTLPFGTRVAVTRLDRPDRAVVVRVNDRGPYAKGRIIDLSEAAAKRLDMIRAGIVRVRLRVLGR